jgi:predicted Zn finger-like uncharacterized protein
MFRVVADQLKLRGGLVRCGACRHVFDAIGTLSYLDDSAAQPVPKPAVKKSSAPPTLFITTDLPPLAPPPDSAKAAARAPRTPAQSESQHKAPVPSESPRKVPAQFEIPSKTPAQFEAPSKAPARAPAPARAAQSKEPKDESGLDIPTLLIPDATRLDLPGGESSEAAPGHAYAAQAESRAEKSVEPSAEPHAEPKPRALEARARARAEAKAKAPSPDEPRKAALNEARATEPQPDVPPAPDASAAPAKRRVRFRPAAAAPAAEADEPAVAAVAQDLAAIEAEEQADEAPEAAPSFLHGGRGERRGFSVVFGGGSVLLALLVLGQLAVLFRTELMTRWPALRPPLVTLCQVAGCTLGWPMRAELLAVVGSELQAIPGTDVLELTATVRNRAPFKLALPAIEVTLTDTQNRALARKVFAPVDYLTSAGEPSGRIDEGLAVGGDYTIKITFEARGVAASGFVVYPFYL